MIEKKNIRVLLVEDDEDDYLITKEILSGIKYTKYILDWVDNYETAIQSVQQSRHDVYLIDYRLGAHDGLELIRNCNSQGYNYPFIILTGQSDYQTDLNAMQAGATDYLIKGRFDEILLERSIRYAIEQKKTEQQLNTAILTKDKFFSIIAHDLKGPFNALLGFSELLLKEYDNRDPEENKEMIKHIYNSSIHGFDLLNNLLEWARSQTGRIEFEPQDFSLNDLIRENILLISDAAYKKNIEVQNEITEYMLAFADRRMINTVVRNLISNALKFTKPGGKIILSHKKENQFIEVTVTDTGVGIKGENISKLFRLEESISTPGTDKEQGTGLGLILCKEFIEKNGGKIWLESEYGKGSKFKFTIPAPGNSGEVLGDGETWRNMKYE